MSNMSVQLYCSNDHQMSRGADWCSTCGEPPARASHARDQVGRVIGVGDRVSWRGQIFTLKSVATNAILAFEEPLHVEGCVPEASNVALVRAAAHNVCRWCGDDCPRWGADACPLRPRQLPRGDAEAK